MTKLTQEDRLDKLAAQFRSWGIPEDVISNGRNEAREAARRHDAKRVRERLAERERLRALDRSFALLFGDGHADILLAPLRATARAPRRVGRTRSAAMALDTGGGDGPSPGPTCFTSRGDAP